MTWPPKAPSDLPVAALSALQISVPKKSSLKPQSARALWATDDLLTFCDASRFGQVRPFPPREVVHERAGFLSSRKQKDSTLEQVSLRRLKESADDGNVEALPRWKRIQLLEGMVSNDETSPSGSKPIEVNCTRAYREFEIRWGSDTSPRYHLGRRKLRIAPGGRLADPTPELPGTISPDQGPTPTPDVPVQEQPISQQVMPTITSSPSTARRHRATSQRFNRWSRDDDPKPLKSDQELLQELEMALSNFDSAAVTSCASLAVHITDLGRALEVRAYRLRTDQLLKALTWVGQSATKLEAHPYPVPESIRRASEALKASMHGLAAAASAGALHAQTSEAVATLAALAAAGAGCQEYMDAQLARLLELLHKEPWTFSSVPLLARLAGSLGSLLQGSAQLCARDGATSRSRVNNEQFVVDLCARITEKLPDFLEDDLALMGWVFPTCYLGEMALRKLIRRAAELQVGLLPENAHCKEIIQHIIGFVKHKMPMLDATLSPFARRYLEKLAI